MALKNLKTIKIYSKKDKKLLDYTVEQTVEKEKDGPNEHEVILVKNGTDVQRYSPAYTDEELQALIESENKEAQSG